MAMLWTGATDETSFVANAFEQLLPAFVPALTAQRPGPAMPSDPSKYIGKYTTMAPRVGNLTFEVASFGMRETS